MNRDPRFALSQELEAKQLLLDQLRALVAEDPDFLTDLIEVETDLLELIAALEASILDDEALVDGAKAALDKLQARKRAASGDSRFSRIGTGACAAIIGSFALRLISKRRQLVRQNSLQNVRRSQRLPTRRLRRTSPGRSGC
jgi:hypothetical protein